MAGRDAEAMTVEPQFFLALVVAIAGAIGSFVAVKQGGAETQRLVKALHTRFDVLEKDVRDVREVQARHDERIKALKQSQRFKLASANGQDMFEDEG